MRPLELTIEGLRSFRAPVTIDLRGRDQIAIVGDTGAGKSSIIEAITYALYGQATFLRAEPGVDERRRQPAARDAAFSQRG